MKWMLSWWHVLIAGALVAGAGVAPANEHARAEEIVQGQCFICHGVDGESSSPIFPRLAGQNEAYVVKQLQAYKSGQRVSSAMQPMVAALNNDDFAALGKYFASRPTSVLEVIQAVEKVSGRKVPYTTAPRRAGDPPALYADSSKAVRELGWTVQFPGINEIVATAWAWHASRPSGYR